MKRRKLQDYKSNPGSGLGDCNGRSLTDSKVLNHSHWNLDPPQKNSSGSGTRSENYMKKYKTYTKHIQKINPNKGAVFQYLILPF